MAFFFIGCAGQKPKDKVDQAERPEPSGRERAPEVVANPDNRVYTDENGRFELVGTPSGYVKKRLDEPEKIPEKSYSKEQEESRPVLSGKDTEKAKAPAPVADKSLPAETFSKKAPQKEDPEDKGQKIVLNFDNADLNEVIITMADILGINYIVDPGVNGIVTIHTARGLNRKDLFPVFFQILEANGLTAVREGSFYKILPMKDSPRMAIDPITTLGQKDIPDEERVIIQIIPLKFIAAQEMTKLITPFMTSGGTVVSDTASNTMLVVDKWMNILKILKLVSSFDINIFEKVDYRFYRLKNLDVEETTKMLDDFALTYSKLSNVQVKFIPITRLNTLLVVSSSPAVFKKVDEILNEIDVVVEATEPRIYVYFVKNGNAAQLKEIMNQVFPESKSEKKESKSEKKESKTDKSSSVSNPGNPFSRARVEEKKAENEAQTVDAKESAKPESSGKEALSEGAGTLRSKINITPDEVRNALIIEAIPSDHRIIENILNQIDILPRQVLIEATIAEITIDTSTEIGMQWAFGQGAAAGEASFAATINKLVQGATTASFSGLNAAVGVTDKWFGALKALATQGKVNVISSPHVLASEGIEAKIDVSREIPVASSSYTTNSATTVTETAIEYRDTGVILTVIPHINDKGLVTLEVAQEVSDLDAPVLVGGKSYPSFFKRNVTTTLTVKHGQTIVIGGLIKDKESESESGVPCLINLPIAKYIFGINEKSTTKIELVVLITPKVIVNLEDVIQVTDEFKQKVKSVIKRFNP
ncbi:MAG TPA: type II secretion system secretin GspD [Deltaproteobacteria bacterium]|nr:type II secretion system secretin GspD [Deltaproteobacteria bacterium]